MGFVGSTRVYKRLLGHSTRPLCSPEHSSRLRVVVDPAARKLPSAPARRARPGTVRQRAPESRAASVRAGRARLRHLFITGGTQGARRAAAFATRTAPASRPPLPRRDFAMLLFENMLSDPVAIRKIIAGYYCHCCYNNSWLLLSLLLLLLFRRRGDTWSYKFLLLT